MDRVCADVFGEADDGIDIKVGADWFAGTADTPRFVGLEAVECVAIFVGVDGGRADAEF